MTHINCDEIKMYHHLHKDVLITLLETIDNDHILKYDKLHMKFIRYMTHNEAAISEGSNLYYDECMYCGEYNITRSPRIYNTTRPDFIYISRIDETIQHHSDDPPDVQGFVAFCDECNDRFCNMCSTHREYCRVCVDKNKFDMTFHIPSNIYLMILDFTGNLD